MSTDSPDEIDAILERYSYAVQSLHAGIRPFNDGKEASRHRAVAKTSLRQLMARERVDELKHIADEEVTWLRHPEQYRKVGQGESLDVWQRIEELQRQAGGES